MAYQTGQAKVWNGTAWENAVQPKAVVSATTGSPTITTDGDATIYTFTGDGSITISKSGMIQALLVGGGGASISDTGGGQTSGGGAGGYLAMIDGENTGGGLASTGQGYIPAGTHTITVGAGGTPPGVGRGGGNGRATFAVGLPSIFGPFIASGGGNGANVEGDVQGNGGSGGGAGYSTFPGLGLHGQGYDGESNSASGGGGGGGAGQPGGTNGSGRGGDGLQTSITGTPTYFAGGGTWGDTALTAALGGGGVRNSPGDANTGGGAGGNNSDNGGQNGGSGIVIVRVG